MDDRPKANSSPEFRTIELKPNHDELLKPAELIDINGAAELTLAARRIYNTLLAHAFGRNMGVEGYEWTIPLSELRGSHTSNDRIGDSIEALMKTIITVRLSNGRTRRVQLLGGNDMGDPDRTYGSLTYSFDKKLVPLLQESTVFGKIELSVMRSFSTKYALALYEAVARRVRLQHVFMEVLTIEEFREMLGVPAGKLTSFGNLNQYAIKPAMAEINALSAFGVSLMPVKNGRKVSSIRLGWYLKDVNGQKAAFAELHRPRTGRKARINGQVDEIVDVQAELPV